MNDIERALAQISDIRTQLASSTRFRGYAPEVLVGIALLAAVLATVLTVWPGKMAINDVDQVVIWGTFLILSSLATGTEAISRTRWKHGGMAPAMLQAAMRIQVPVTVVGLVIAYGICRFAPETAWVVPGTWLLLISLVFFIAQPIMPPTIIWGAVWFGVMGTVVILLAGQDQRFSPWMMGVPIFVGYLFMARVLKKEGEEIDVG